MKRYILLTMCITVSQSLFAQWTTSGSNIYYNAGNVGIGIASPSTKLHVSGLGGDLNVGNSPTSGDMIIQANTGGRIQSKGAQLEFVIPANSNGSNMWGQGRIMTVAGNSATGNASGKMILGTRRYWYKPGTSGHAWYYGDDLTIDSEGRIGIGSVNPTNTLHVQGSTHFGVSSGLPSNATANSSSNYVEKYGLRMTSSNNGFYISLSTSVNERKVYLQSGHESSTYAYGIGPICINPFGGNVGIGSTNPTSKLTVKGTVHAEEVKVDLSVPGPDYVFEEDYQLQSLEEIESYVKQKKHLPDVPSASEMEKEGIKVGEMNVLLLKKIEEMMLHMIEMKKEIQRLKENKN